FFRCRDVLRSVVIARVVVDIGRNFKSARQRVEGVAKARGAGEFRSADDTIAAEVAPRQYTAADHQTTAAKRNAEFGKAAGARIVLVLGVEIGAVGGGDQPRQ